MLRYADRIILLQDGRIAASGTPEALCADGSIERVFDVSVCSLDLPEGRQYYFRNLFKNEEPPGLGRPPQK